MSSPYQTPLEAPPESGFSLEDIRSAPRAKFFGVAHISLATLGFIASIGLASWLIRASVAVADFENHFGDQPDATTSSLYSYFVTIQHTVLLVTLATSIPTVPLLASGILLLRRRSSSRIWSNLYAITSITGKIVLAIYAIIQSTVSWSGGIFASLLTPTNIVTILFFAALCIYPALSLYLLNPPAFKRWLAGAETA